MNKSQQFILSEHLEEIKDASKFADFLVTKRLDTLSLEEVNALCKSAILLDMAISRIEKITQK